MTIPLLELHGIHHRFGSVLALDGAGIVVRPGTVHALLGENGAGKSTLMRIAFGLLRPDAGEMRVNGRAVAPRTPGHAMALGVGMVHQHFSLVPALTVAENVALGGRGRLDRRAIGARIAAIGERSGLHVDPDARVETLGVAAQQRVEIVKAVDRGARVLVLDEPTSVLAPSEADSLLRWLRGFASEGNAAVLITHRIPEALAISDDVTVLRRGCVTLRTPSHRLAERDVVHAMLGGAGAERRDASDTRPVGVARDAARERHAPPVVRFDTVSARRGREQLHDVSLTLWRGEITGVAAIDGAGQHLLLRIIAGRADADTGIVERPERAGFIPEDRHRDALVLEHALDEAAALPGSGMRRGRMQWRVWRDRARALVHRADVRGAGSDAARTRGRALSGGNQQRFVVARELAESGDLLVAENPTRGLDIAAAADVHHRLRAAADAGASVVVHSADLDEVLALADRVLVVVDHGVREMPRDRDAVGRAMLGVGAERDP